MEPLAGSHIATILEEAKSLSKTKPKDAFKKFSKLLVTLLAQYGHRQQSDIAEEAGVIIEKSLANKMKQGGGKAKGAGFEREICDKLSLWISDGEQNDIFWRSAMSGGRATVAMKKGKKLANQSSDISPIHSLGEALTTIFSIECKFYADLGIEGFVFGAKSGLKEFWDQVTGDARMYNKQPMLIAKQNRRPVILVFNSSGIAHLTRLYGPLPVHFVAPNADMHVMDFELFLELADPQALILAKGKLAPRNKLKRR